jgi:hypothetical protein
MMILYPQLPSRRASRSGAVGTIGVVEDYAGAWSAERGRCFRLVYGSEDGHPEHCPERLVRSGWKREGSGGWYAVDACERHALQVADRPSRDS